MNLRQKWAAANLQKALDRCHDAGLKGGVFDSRMRVWPINTTPDPYDSGRDFFKVIAEKGATVESKMSLDGGAGV